MKNHHSNVIKRLYLPESDVAIPRKAEKYNMGKTEKARCKYSGLIFIYFLSGNSSESAISSS